MASTQQLDQGRPVARLVSPVVWRVGLLVAAMALVCIAGVAVCTQAVSHLTQRVEPAARTHQQVVLDLAELESAVADWSLSGATGARAAFAEVRARLASDQAALRDLVDDDTETAVAVEVQTRAATTWLEQYADPRVLAAGGPATFDADRHAVGRDLYDRWRVAALDTSAQLDERVEEASAAAVFRFRATIVVAALLLVLSWVVIARARWTLLDELSQPLLALETTVQRMLRNDPDARAEHRGPKEVRALARALNDLADDRQRARAVEGRIQDELRVLDGAKDEFVSNVTHELRTPLTTISGYLEMIAEEFEGRLAPRHERMLEATRRNVTRLKALIDDLLALSRAEDRPSEGEPSDAAEMVRDAVTDVRITGARRDIAIEVTAPPEALPVVADRAMLHRAFLNVLTNAVKFSHDGGVVEVDLRRVGSRVEIAVRDHGIGIPRAELDRLGTRFFRASNAVTNEIAGTGLGLRIVQTIVDKHAGDLVIESAEGTGTTVFVRLRLHRPTRSVEPEEATYESLDGQEFGLHHPR